MNMSKIENSDKPGYWASSPSPQVFLIHDDGGNGLETTGSWDWFLLTTCRIF